LVSRQHAVLNLVENDWFVEDIGSVNGSGLKRMNDSSNIVIEQGEPYKIDTGDIIYIANTKLLVR
ncbi:MAG TPA: FHA domain-containing protein, partial [Clostridia bacterium]